MLTGLEALGAMRSQRWAVVGLLIVTLGALALALGGLDHAREQRPSEDTTVVTLRNVSFRVHVVKGNALATHLRQSELGSFLNGGNFCINRVRSRYPKPGNW